MAMGGEPVEARNAAGVGTIKAEEGRSPLVGADGLAMGDADIERSLARFAEAAASNPTNPPRIPTELDGVLREISIAGVPYYGWGGLKELIAARMLEVVGALEKESGFVRAGGGSDYVHRRDELVASLRSFDAAPFTLQRLAEVLQDPRRQYSSTHKLINGLERMLAVSSTLATRSRKAATRTAAPGATTAMSNGAACPSGGVVVGSSQGNAVVASVAVKVEEQPAENNGSANPAVVPTEDETAAQEGSDSWKPEGGNEARGPGPGRKRLKMEVKAEAPVMSE